VSAEREILNIDEAAQLLGVSVKTFNKVLHAEDLPARKVGREWKFSRRALIDWVGSGHSKQFYKESSGSRAAAHEDNGSSASEGRSNKGPRRTAGWSLELD
jgi:excisionase family DNA binding protein